MKKSFFMTISIIVILIVITIVLVCFQVLNNNSNSDEIINLKNINNIKSKYNEYILAVDDLDEYPYTYSVYKNSNYDDYKKIFSFKDTFYLEGRVICWNNDTLYILYDKPRSYNLSTGQIINQGDSFKLLNGYTGTFTRVFGIFYDYIYYEFDYKGRKYYGKTDLQLKDYYLIKENEIPKELIN